MFVFPPKRLIFYTSIVQNNTHTLFRRFVALDGREEAAVPVSFLLAPMISPLLPREEKPGARRTGFNWHEPFTLSFSATCRRGACESAIAGYSISQPMTHRLHVPFPPLRLPYPRDRRTNESQEAITTSANPAYSANSRSCSTEATTSRPASQPPAHHYHHLPPSSAISWRQYKLPHSRSRRKWRSRYQW